MSELGTGPVRRRRTTPRSVRRQELLARAFVTAGGMGTIVTVLLIFGFLLWVVLPLFQGAELEHVDAVAHGPQGRASALLACGTGGEGTQSYSLFADGVLRVTLLSDGSMLREDPALGRAPITAWAFSPDGPEVAFGFADGTVQTGAIRMATTFLPDDEVPDAARGLHPGAVLAHAGGVLRVTAPGQFRLERFQVTLGDPLAAATDAISLLDLSIAASGAPLLAWLTQSGVCEVARIKRTFNILEDRHVEQLGRERVPVALDPLAKKPSWLLLSGVGNGLSLIWEDGQLQRHDLRSGRSAQESALGPVEKTRLVPEGGRVTAVRYLAGKSTLLVGDDAGTVGAWFPTRPADAYTRDGIELKRAHVLPGVRSAVTALAVSGRSRLAGVAYADGHIRLYNVTNERLIGEVGSSRGGVVDHLVISPKEDGLLAVSAEATERWRVDIGHPEAGLKALFAKVWYEGAAQPAHEWQAEGGSDGYEPKLGLIKLVFGTLKATLYSILFAAPLALLAALFTSEFLNPRWRSPIKSMVEIMAGLPSVVLGFLAAMVIAPYVRHVLPVVLGGVVIVPLTFVAGSRLWQLLPTSLALRWAGWPRLLAMALAAPLGIWIAVHLGPWLERACFGGDVEQWLRGSVADVRGGWAFLLFPAALLVVGFAMSRTLGPWIKRRTASIGAQGCALVDLLRFIVLGGAAALLAWGLGQALWGTDPRGGVIGAYDLRNAMIVGFVMGFAIVPIIYTLAEDALSSVPRALREASLGCGATPWQTAARIVVPTAMSGLFTALMVGLGRAVGETMIVLMAAGNTPILDWNVFSGFRTLSANIATELPEAVKGSTHYRVLFLAGFVLFLVTFLINTVAELVRRRFRRRFSEL